MSNPEKLRQFFEQVIYTAAQKTGDTSGIMPVIKNFVKELGIETGTESIEELNARIKAGELENEKEKAAAELAVLGAGYAGTDQDKRQELIEAIQQKFDVLKKTVTVGPKIITSKELMQKCFTPRKWVVENLIGPGLSILSGAPKIGKSWLLFALAEAASTGGKFLDQYDVNQTPTLHLSLEDTERSIKERREILAHKQAEKFTGNDKLFIATEWDAGPSGLEAYLRAHNEIRFVIIDTLGRFMPEIEDMSEYAPAVKALAGIKKIADTLDIAILIVHHAKKGSDKDKGEWMDQSLGSQGIVGSADTIILLQRNIDKKTGERLNTGKLYTTGRSIKDRFHHVKFSPDFGTWGITEKSGESEDDDTGEAPTPEKPKILTRADIEGKG